MPIIVEQAESGRVIRIEGEFSVTAAAELKTMLLEALNCGSALEVDLERAGEIDITLLQLLWAAGREEGSRPGGIVGAVSDSAARAAREAGFESFPGKPADPTDTNMAPA